MREMIMSDYNEDGVGYLFDKEDLPAPAKEKKKKKEEEVKFRGLLDIDIEQIQREVDKIRKQPRDERTLRSARIIINNAFIRGGVL